MFSQNFSAPPAGWWEETHYSCWQRKAPHYRKCRALGEENPLRLAVYPPYSPDLAPSDFFLFGHIKYCL
jgi:hypothetical protein